MHYIINPWVFYLISVVDGLIITCLVFVIGFAFVYGIYSLFWLAEINGCSYEDEWPNPKSILKKFTIPLIFCIASLIFVPSSDTIYKMMIASQVTTENIGTAKETIQDVADYIIDAVKEIKEKE